MSKDLRPTIIKSVHYFNIETLLALDQQGSGQLEDGLSWNKAQIVKMLRFIMTRGCQIIILEPLVDNLVNDTERGAVFLKNLRLDAKEIAQIPIEKGARRAGQNF